MFRMMNASNRSSPWSPLDDKLGLSSLLLPSSLAEEMERLFINETTAMPPISPSAISNSNTNFGTLNQISLAQMAQTLQRNDSPSSPSAAPMTSSTSSVFMPNNMLDYQTMMRTRRRLGSGDSVGGSSSGSSLTPPGSDLITDFRCNGWESDMDEIDQIMQRSRPTRAEELLGLTSRDHGYRTAYENSPDILTKEHLLALLSRGRYLKKRQQKKGLVCVFCRNNGEAEAIYLSHVLKDGNGRVMCPVLRAYTCPNCHASGDTAHTLKYCPLSTGDTPNIRSLKTARTATGKKRALP